MQQGYHKLVKEGKKSKEKKSTAGCREDKKPKKEEKNDDEGRRKKRGRICCRRNKQSLAAAGQRAVNQVRQGQGFAMAVGVEPQEIARTGRVVLVGPPPVRSGGSCLAGVLHAMGAAKSSLMSWMAG